MLHDSQVLNLSTSLLYHYALTWSAVIIILENTDCGTITKFDIQSCRFRCHRVGFRRHLSGIWTNPPHAAVRSLNACDPVWIMGNSQGKPVVLTDEGMFRMKTQSNRLTRDSEPESFSLVESSW